MLSRSPVVAMRTIAIAALCLAWNNGSAQPYTQDKAVRLIAGFPAGSASDNLARILTRELMPALGRSVIVDNRPGATGNIAAELTTKAAPDGYTILLASNTLAVVSSLYRKLTYDPIKDFTPVGLVATSPLILIVSTEFSANTVSDLVRLAKAKPGQLNYGSAGNGSGPHMAMELFKTMAAVDIIHVPYKGVPAALSNLLGARIPIMFSTLSPAIPLIKAGKVRPLAITSAQRFAIVPDVPALAESIPGFEMNAWWGLLLPAAAQQPVVDKLNQAVAKIVATPNVRQALVEQGYKLETGTPERFGAFIRAEIAKWGKVVKISGARLD